MNEKIKEELNKDQKKAAFYNGPHKNIFVVAGPGSGKTKTMVSRVQFLIENKNIDPSKILCLTFTNKASKEMKSRMTFISDDVVDQITACTFHSFCLQIIKQIPKSFGFEGVPTIIDSSEQKTLFKSSRAKILEEENISDEIISKVPKVEKILSEYSFARNSFRSIDYQFRNYVDNDIQIINICKKIINDYEEQKTNYKYVDFDDILSVFVKKCNDKDELALAISELYEEVLVDELQDTNPIQYEILKILGNKKTRIFAVGDPAQSIYSFRGADFNSIYNFKNIFIDSEEINLSIDYRNSQEIVECANALLKDSNYNYNNKLISNKGITNNKVLLNSFYSKEEESLSIVKDIIKKIENGYSYKDIFIIVRSAYYSISIESYLNKFHIPYEKIGGISINKTSHVRDLISLIKTVINKEDKLATIHYLSMFKGVGDKSSLNIFDKISKMEVLSEEYIKCFSKIKDENALKFIKISLEAIKNKNNIIKELLNNGFEEFIKERYKDNYEYRIEQIESLMDIYYQYDGDVYEFISDFTLEPSLTKTVTDTEKDNDKVTLITAHSVKGLEREICYVAGCSAPTFPSIKSIGNLSSEEEERRVFFVAITRAKTHLIMSKVDEYNTLYKNSKTNIDFLSPFKNFVKRNNKRNSNQNLKNISKLKDIF